MKSLMVLWLHLPLDTARSIAAATDRNRDRWQHEAHSKAHAESLTSTIQTLSLTHQEALLSLQHKYSKKNEHAESLSGKLTVASSEIQNMQDAYRNSQSKVERLEGDCGKLEQVLIKERSDLHTQLNDRQRDLNAERESRSKTEELHQKYTIDTNQKYFELDSNYRKALLELQVASKDKSLFLEDMEGLKDRERKLNDLWEGEINDLYQIKSTESKSRTIAKFWSYKT